MNETNITIAAQGKPAKPEKKIIKKPMVAKSTAFEAFLAAHKTTPDKTATHTRITGGSYCIEDHELPAFLELYDKEIIRAGRTDSLTEKQRDDGPLLMDLDFRFAPDHKERQYTDAHVNALVSQLKNAIQTVYDLDAERIECYVMEKPEPVLDEAQGKPVIKDGIHLLAGVKASPQVQKYVRERMLPLLPQIFAGLPVTNSWETVLDDSIARGSTNWQLYGSSKPGKKPYVVTRRYTITADGATPVGNVTGVAIADLSARRTGYEELTPTLGFCRYLQDQGLAYGSASGPIGGKATGDAAGRADIEAMRGKMQVDFDAIAAVRSEGDWRPIVEKWLAKATTEQRLVYDCVMALPAAYYELGQGTREKWISTCWALRNTGYDMLVAWIDLSARAQGFSFAKGVRDLIYEWEKDYGSNRGLRKGSIMYWCKQDNAAEYAEIMKRDIDPYLDQCAMNPTHEDLALILHKMYKNDYVCTKGNVWYEAAGHRWQLSDNGYGLRKQIGELRKIYKEKSAKIVELIRSIANGTSAATSAATNAATATNAVAVPVAVPINADAPPVTNYTDAPNYTEQDGRTKQLLETKKKYTEICAKLGDTNMKDNIMKEARELFYDGGFVGKLDEKTGLLCFNNGIVDFNAGVFRRGQPDDFISMCTNIDYVPMSAALLQQGFSADLVFDPAKHQPIVDDIYDFMRKIYPHDELREYMFEHLASALTGNENQVFNIYIGNGSNGKSVLTKLMADVLGDYKRDVPLTLITEKRQKVGGVAPEIAELKGVRYAVMQESSKGDAVNEGVLKQLTSGTDTIQGRQLYAPGPTRFVPQFKLVMCTNEFLDIKSMDGGTWRRMRTVNHVSKFTDRPSEDPAKHEFQKLTESEIKDKMTPLWKQLFISLLVSKAFATRGVVKDCAMVLEANEAYKARQDIIGTFISEELVEDAGASVKKDELSNHYKQWWEKTQNGKVAKKDELWAYLDGKYGKYHSVRGWMGIRVGAYDN